MRKFLILDRKMNNTKTVKLTIKGFIESPTFPAYDEETALAKFGISNPKIIEITDKCSIELIS